MRCWTSRSVLAFVLCAVVGCGAPKQTGDNSGSAGQGSTTAPNGGATATADAAQGQGGPTEAVSEFLEAVRTGNDEKASKMFTPLARKKASEMDIQVAPRGSDTARYTVGKVEYVSDEVARVDSTWTDLNKENKRETNAITWALRKEDEGWRVAGMSAVVFKGEPPLLLDFENPEETLNRLELLREEVQRRKGEQKGEMAAQQAPLDAKVENQSQSPSQDASPPPKQEAPAVQQAQQPQTSPETVQR